MKQPQVEAVIEENKNENFVQFPRKLKDDYLSGKLNWNQYDVLNWIWVNTNPYNGHFQADYQALCSQFNSKITYVNMRKIISFLRKEQYIHFTNHKGRKGAFIILPINFPLTNKKKQTLEYIKNKSPITTPPLTQTQPEPVPEHNSGILNHNFEELKRSLIKPFPTGKPVNPITTPYNDTNNKNNKIIDNIFLNKNQSDNRLAYKKEIPVETFFPKTWEQQRCQEIAKELGETDMRFILSCLHKYGPSLIERAWGNFKEIPRHKIEDPAKYFNKLIRNLAEKRYESRRD